MQINNNFVHFQANILLHAICFELYGCDMMTLRLAASSRCHGVVVVVVIVALRPMSTAMDIAGRSVHLTTLFPGQA